MLEAILAFLSLGVVGTPPRPITPKASDAYWFITDTYLKECEIRLHSPEIHKLTGLQLDTIQNYINAAEDANATALELSHLDTAAVYARILSRHGK